MAKAILRKDHHDAEASRREDSLRQPGTSAGIWNSHFCRTGLAAADLLHRIKLSNGIDNKCTTSLSPHRDLCPGIAQNAGEIRKE